MRSARAGFTLIEVMISIAILALALATVFGSNISGARSTAHARMVTRATLMARCRMSEVEAYLQRNQLPATEQTIEDPTEMGADPCCSDGVTCVARVELIELPQPAAMGTAAGNSLLGRAAGAAQGSSFGSFGAGDAGASPMGALAGAMGMMGAGATGATGASAGSASMSGSGAPSAREMATQLLTAVYPTIKPLLEGAIRKVTVTVAWFEGSREHHFDVVEYMTNPGQTLPTGDQLNGLGAPGQTGLPGAAGTTGTGATGTSGATGTPMLPAPMRFP